MINKDLLKKYAKLKAKEKQVEAEIKIMAPEILKQMGKNDEIESDFGRFYRAKKRNWIYPQDITKAEEALKANKKRAEQLGEATYLEKEFLIYKNE